MTFENELPKNELGSEMVQMYLMLRKSKKIGCIWKTGELVEFSEAENILDRRILPIGEYRKLISYWYPTNQKEIEKHDVETLNRKPPKREDHIRSAWNRRYYS